MGKKKKINENKVSKTAGILGGTLGAGALATAYSINKGIDKRSSQMLPGGSNKALIDAIKAVNTATNRGDDITKDEAKEGVKNYFYNSDGTLKDGFTEEYVDNWIKQITENSELYTEGAKQFAEGTNVITFSNLSNLKTQLGNATQNLQISQAKVDKFVNSLGVKDGVGITQDEFNELLEEWLKDNGITNENIIDTVTNAIKNVPATTNPPASAITIFSNGGIARGEVLDLDKLTNIDIMQLSKKSAMGDLAGTIKEGVASWRDNIAGNSLLCREIADKLDVGPENVASAGIATTLTLAGLGIGYGCKKLAEKFLQKKKAKEAGLEGPSPEKKVAQQANAVQVQMAEDLENTASHGYFNNRS